MPQVVLPLWFFRVQGSATLPATLPFEELRRYFAPPQALFFFSSSQLRLAEWISTGFLLLLLLTLWREMPGRERRGLPAPGPANAFLLLALGALLLYFFAPAGMSGGSLLIERLSLYPYLLLIPWLAPRLGWRSRTAVVAALSLLAAMNLGYLIRWYRVLGEETERFVAGIEMVRPRSRLVAVLFSRRLASEKADVYGHAAAYAALEKGLIDWDNYAAKTSFFPVRFRSGVRFPAMDGLDARPGDLQVRANRAEVDAVYTWQMPEGQPLQWRLRRDYNRVTTRGGGELYERRPMRRVARGGS